MASEDPSKPPAIETGVEATGLIQRALSWRQVHPNKKTHPAPTRSDFAAFIAVAQLRGYTIHGHVSTHDIRRLMEVSPCNVRVTDTPSMDSKVCLESVCRPSLA
jgi:hypothetical protein